MGDMHLINLALAGISVSAGAAILVAVAIIGFAALRLHGKSRTQQTGRLLSEPVSVAAASAVTRERRAA